MIVALTLCFAGLVFLLWLTFNLAVYALPFFAGLSAAMFAYHHDAGLLGAAIVGLFAGVFTLVIGQFLFALFRSPWMRAAIAAIYAAPAGVAGWHLAYGLFRIAGIGEPWHSGFAWIGGVLIAGVAWVRVTALQPEIEAARQRGRGLGKAVYGGERTSGLSRPPSVGSMTGAMDRRR
jgi:hypothetical protein